jgi:hypothetical protein
MISDRERWTVSLDGASGAYVLRTFASSEDAEAFAREVAAEQREGWQALAAPATPGERMAVLNAAAVSVLDGADRVRVDYPLRHR